MLCSIPSLNIYLCWMTMGVEENKLSPSLVYSLKQPRGELRDTAQQKMEFPISWSKCSRSRCVSIIHQPAPQDCLRNPKLRERLRCCRESNSPIKNQPWMSIRTRGGRTLGETLAWWVNSERVAFNTSGPDNERQINMPEKYIPLSKERVEQLNKN